MPLKIDCRANDTDKHEFDINYLLYHKGKLYSGSDDGKIIVWSPDLKKVAEVQSNPCSVYCLAGSDTSVYSCSNEGTVKSFGLDTLKEKSIIAQDDQTEFWRICYDNDCLYTGDHYGNIKVYKNDIFYGQLCISEPVSDMMLHKNLLFTANLDLVITDMRLGSNKLQYGTKNTFTGRGPIALIGDQYFAFSSREAMDIIVHENNDSSHFKKVTSAEKAHEKVINTMAGTNWKEKYVLFSGGWDKVVKKWTIEGDKLIQNSSCELDFVINHITIGEPGDIYIGGSDGCLVRVKVD